MANTRASVLYAVLLFILIAAMSWPVFAAVSSILAHVSGEGWQLDAVQLEPVRNITAHFLDGYRASAPLAAAMGVVAVVDYVLLSKYRATWLLGGILLPVAGGVLAFTFYREPTEALPALAATGLVLAVLYRLADVLRRLIA